MRLHIFTPLPPSRSGIADYMMHILPELCRRAEVTLWTIQESWAAEVEEQAEVRRLVNAEPDVWRQLHAGHTIYQIGNNAQFHAGIWEISRHHPGTVILHDARLLHLFASLHLTYWQDADGLRNLLERYYGVIGRRACDRFFDGITTVDALAARFPLTPYATDNALSVVTHTQGAFSSLLEYSGNPVFKLGLPFRIRHEGRGHSTPDVDAEGSGVIRLVVFGHLAANRRLEPFMEALSALPERRRFQLDIYGDVWDPTFIEQRRDALGLRDQVRLHGFVDDERLNEALSRSHLAVNLRYPSMGEASFSQLQIWEHALPSLVTRTGWFAEIDQEAVFPIRPEHEAADIRAALRAFAANPEAAAEMGRRGRRILETEHMPALYVDRLLEAVQAGERSMVQAGAQITARTIGLRLSRELRPSVRRVAEERIREALAELYLDPPPAG